MNSRATVVLSRHWNDPRSELGFLSRSLAGAATRFGNVAVLGPGAPGQITPDGAFDVQGLGAAPLRWPDSLPEDAIAIVDELTDDIAALLRGSVHRDVFYVVSGVEVEDPSWRGLRLYGDEGERIVHVHVPVNQLAERHRHNGFGFVGYVLVLGGREPPGDELPAEAAGLTAAAHRRHVVVIEGGVASAWKGRALRGRVAVETRMDLWRLMAHACACVDLAPGPAFARECVESMRFGTPIVVARASGAAAVHAASGGGQTYADAAERLASISKLEDEANRSEASMRARRYADSRYGTPDRMVESLRDLISSN